MWRLSSARIYVACVGRGAPRPREEAKLEHRGVAAPFRAPSRRAGGAVGSGALFRSSSAAQIVAEFATCVLLTLKALYALAAAPHRVFREQRERLLLLALEPRGRHHGRSALASQRAVPRHQRRARVELARPRRRQIHRARVLSPHIRKHAPQRLPFHLLFFLLILLLLLYAILACPPRAFARSDPHHTARLIILLLSLSHPSHPFVSVLARSLSRCCAEPAHTHARVRGAYIANVRAHRKARLAVTEEMDGRDGVRGALCGLDVRARTLERCA
mmetsp:Transcript_1526/g.4058  ORF Transcript_1526/g.4058 Transcript_1526/m.4058 type:complete len:274 (-) Transcript_1526:228-1049(-)